MSSRRFYFNDGRLNILPSSRRSENRRGQNRWGTLFTLECFYRVSDSPRVSFLIILITMRQLTVVGSSRPVNLDDCRFASRRDLRRGSYCAAVVIKARITLRTILNEPYYDGREPSIYGTIVPYAILQTVRIKFRYNRRRKG